MVEDIDFLILGSGFAGRLAATQLSDRGRVVMVDVSGFLRSAIFEPNIGLDPNQLARTQSASGGLFAWGGGLTSPLSGQWTVKSEENGLFSQAIGRLRTGPDVDLVGAAFGISRGQFEIHGRHREFLKNFSDPTLEPELHIRAPAPQAGLGLVDQNVRQIVGASLQGMEFDSTIGLDLRVRTPENSAIRLRSKRVVLAAGAFMNGVFSCLFTGAKSFKLGNHLTVSGPSLELPRPFLHRGIVHYPGAKSWTTFSKPGERANALRLVQDNSVSSMRNVFSARTSQSDSAIHKLISAKSKFSKWTSSLVMFDLRPDEGAHVAVNLEFGRGQMHIHTLAQSSQTTGMRTVVSELLRGYRSPYGVHGSPSFESPSDRLGMVMSDAAHYYGSTPFAYAAMGSPSVDEQSILRSTGGKVLVLGSSILPEGGHAHPTYLILALANESIRNFATIG